MSSARCTSCRGPPSQEPDVAALWRDPTEGRLGRKEMRKMIGCTDFDELFYFLFLTQRGIPDMQPITLQIPRAFIASTMFFVPSDIMVVGPNEYKLD